MIVIFTSSVLNSYTNIDQSTRQYIPQYLSVRIRGLHMHLSDDMTGVNFEALYLQFALTFAFRICSKVPMLNLPNSEMKL
jgi:hypothetical protein